MSRKPAKAELTPTQKMEQANEKRYDNGYLGVNVTEIAQRMFKIKAEDVTAEQAAQAWEAYLAVLHTQPAVEQQRIENLKRREKRLNNNIDAFKQERTIFRRDERELRQKVRGLEETVRLQSDALGASGIEAYRASVREALADLITHKFRMLDSMNFVHKNPYYNKGDENAPFGTEAHLYVQYGKEEARTLLSKLRTLAELAGVADLNDLFEADDAEK